MKISVSWSIRTAVVGGSFSSYFSSSVLVLSQTFHHKRSEGPLRAHMQRSEKKKFSNITALVDFLLYRVKG